MCVCGWVGGCSSSFDLTYTHVHKKVFTTQDVYRTGREEEEEEEGIEDLQTGGGGGDRGFRTNFTSHL